MDLLHSEILNLKRLTADLARLAGSSVCHRLKIAMGEIIRAFYRDGLMMFTGNLKRIHQRIHVYMVIYMNHAKYHVEK